MRPVFVKLRPAWNFLLDCLRFSPRRNIIVPLASLCIVPFKGCFIAVVIGYSGFYCRFLYVSISTEHQPDSGSLAVRYFWMCLPEIFRGQFTWTTSVQPSGTDELWFILSGCVYCSIAARSGLRRYSRSEFPGHRSRSA